MISITIRLATLVLITCYFNYYHYSKKIELIEKQVKCLKVGKMDTNL
ncbi:MAG: hypothetical protein Q8936_21670 [Bacillota bacterium]|nr:hypothetical protein [Bacillota bacterium]